MSDYNLLIDGKMVPGDLEMPVLNPATEEVVAQCPRATKAQLDQAVAAAKAAFPAWAATPIEERRKYIVKMADVIEANAGELARIGRIGRNGERHVLQIDAALFGGDNNFGETRSPVRRRALIRRRFCVLHLRRGRYRNECNARKHPRYISHTTPLPPPAILLVDYWRDGFADADPTLFKAKCRRGISPGSFVIGVLYMSL